MFQALLVLTFLASAYGQQAGNLTTETHPKMTWQKCASGGSCTSQSGTVVLDSNWRWLHWTKNYTNCYDGNTWDSSACKDPATCAKNCALDGADYSGTYGITTSSNQLKMVFVTEGQYSTNIGSRVYMLASDTKYMMYKLLNQEFTFTVDVSNLPCGLNGALYFVEMDEDGGMGKFSSNKAGAKFGTGYCDAQCPHDIKFINGEGNMQDWTPSDTDKNAGSGKYGTCCTEMDIWEANSMGAAYTPHPCTSTGQTRCDGTNCGDADERHDGYCDKDGCDYSHFRLGDKSYYGKGKTVDSTKPFTVVTQFITDTGTDSGTLKEIRRLYVQGGKVIQNSKVNMPGVPEYDSITDQFCADYKVPIGDPDTFKAKGGMKKMSDVMKKGMVLVMSIWDDHAAHMLWLDSNYPTDKDASVPGVARGECPTDSGDPADIEADSPKASVTYSDIRVGPLNSTYKSK